MRPLKLAAVKQAINTFVPVLARLAPGIGPRRPVSLITRELFKYLRKVVEMSPERYYPDKNFPQLLEALEKTLIFIAEEDGHYAGMLAQAYLLIYRLVNQTRPGYGPGPVGDIAWLSAFAGQPIHSYKVTE